MSIELLIGSYKQASVHHSASLVSNPFLSHYKTVSSSLIDTLDMEDPEPLLGSVGMLIKMTDAMDTVGDFLESEDIIRNGRSVDVLLYYMEYTPGRGHKDDLLEDSNFGQEYEAYEHSRFVEYTCDFFEDQTIEIPTVEISDFDVKLVETKVDEEGILDEIDDPDDIVEIQANDVTSSDDSLVVDEVIIDHEVSQLLKKE